MMFENILNPTDHPSNSRYLHSGFVVYEVAIRTVVRNNRPGATLRSCTSNLGRLTYPEVLHDDRRSSLRSRETLFHSQGTAVRAIVFWHAEL